MAVPRVAWSHLRRHWRSAAIVVVLVGLAGAAVLAAVDGMRQTRTAVPRFLEATRFPDAFVTLPPAAGSDDVDPADIARLESLPGVAAVAPAAHLVMVPADLELPPGREARFIPFAGTDERLGRDVLAPRILAGRRADPSRVDEIVVNETTATALSVGVGDTVRFASLTPVQVEQLNRTGTVPESPGGPEVGLRVVGVARSFSDLLAGENLDDFPVIATPALYQRYRTSVGTYEGILLVTLTAGAEPDAFMDAFDRAFGDEASAGAGGDLPPSIDQAVDTETFALAAFAVVVALAGLAAAGQALARQLSLAAPELETLRALGMSAASRTLVGLTAAVPVAVASAALSVAGAIVLSTRLPIGVAGRADPDPGISVHAVVLSIGAASVVAAVLALAALATWRATRLATGRAPTARGSVIARRVGQAGLPPSCDIGVRMALEPGRDRRSLSTRSALVAGSASVTGLLAALVVGSSLARLLDSPERYGWNWDVTVGAGTEKAAADELAADVAGMPEVDGVATVTTGLVRVADRRVFAFGFGSSHGTVAPTILDGRAPRANDEVALGSETMARLGLSLGDSVRVGPPGEEQSLRIVGRAVLPRIDNDEPANGAIVAGDLDRLHPLVNPDAAGISRTLAVRFAADADHAAAVARLQESGLPVTTDLRPVDVDTLAQVRGLPWILAGVVATVGTLALGHALITTVRRRRHDLAVLGGLGFVRRQVRRVIGWQATTVAAISVGVGVPLGLAAGGWGWGLLARSIGMADDALFPAAAVMVVALATPLVARAIATLPAHAATRTRPAAGLRSE